MAHPDTIMRQRFSDATVQYQLAELKGVRFVSVSETKRGVELEESTVKQITGNDTISARAPYGRPFTYRPQFKLWMSTNHKPEIPDGSEAIWDRMRLIPFTQRFDGKDADPKLPAKLREELPGVLAWAVRGCVEWMQHGLGTSEAVEKATAEYREETDVLDRFLADACVIDPERSVSKSDLYEAWEGWTLEEGEETGTKIDLTKRLREKGVVKKFREEKIDNKTRGWVGIGLRESSPPPPSEKLSQPENPCKHVGGETPERQLSKDEEKLSRKSPRGEGSEKSGESCLPVSELSQETVTTPLSWDFDGGRINYMPEGE